MNLKDRKYEENCTKAPHNQIALIEGKGGERFLIRTNAIWNTVG